MEEGTEKLKKRGNIRTSIEIPIEWLEAKENKSVTWKHLIWRGFESFEDKEQILICEENITKLTKVIANMRRDQIVKEMEMKP